ncbi:MAG TPA: DUF5666 domain-containing protein [Thermoleophilaceae bacterium]
MKQLLLSSAAAIALLALPAAAGAAQRQSGAVLRVDRAHHRLELVDSQHAVRSYTTPRRTPRRLRRGVRVSFQASGVRVSALRVDGRASRLSFYGTVVSSSASGVVLRLGDGQKLTFGGHHAARHGHTHSGPSLQINVEGLQQGQIVLVSETIYRDGTAVAIKPVAPSSGGNQNGSAPAPAGGQEADVTGTITAIGPNSLTIQTAGGVTMTFQADPDLTDDYDIGDAVDVTYETAADGTLVAGDVEPADDSGDDQDVLGTVTAIGANSLTLHADDGSTMTFEADSDLTDGFSPGDYVDVTYYTDTDGSLVADDVEPGPDPSP